MPPIGYLNSTQIATRNAISVENNPRGTPKAPPGSGLNSIHGPSSSRVYANLAHELGMAPTIMGRSISPGRNLGSLLRLPGKGLRELGNAIQGGNQHYSTSESKFRYATGGFFKSIGNVLSGAAGLVGGAAVYAEHKVSDFGGFALRMVGAGFLGTASLAAYGVGKLAGNTSVGESGFRTAKEWILNSPMLSRRTELDVTVAVAKEFSQDLEFAAGKDDRKLYLKQEDLPPGIESRFKFGALDQVKDQYGVSSDVPVISTGGWTKLTVHPSWGEPLNAKNPDQPRTLYLNFKGSNFSGGWGRDTGMQGLANARTDAAQALGIPDGAFREARDIAQMFVDQYKGTNVTVCLVGHSMGGALAQYAGIAASTPENPVRVTCFNSAGLHPHLLEKLGAEKINISDVTHFTNTPNPDELLPGSGDTMQFVDGKNTLLVPTLKVGVMYRVPISKFDHGMEPISAHFEAIKKDPKALAYDYATQAVNAQVGMASGVNDANKALQTNLSLLAQSPHSEEACKKLSDEDKQTLIDALEASLEAANPDGPQIKGLLSAVQRQLWGPELFATVSQHERRYLIKQRLDWMRQNPGLDLPPEIRDMFNPK